MSPAPTDDPVILYGEVSATLAHELASADGKTVIPKGAHVVFQFNPSTSVMVVQPLPGGDDKVIVASFKEITGSAIR